MTIFFQCWYFVPHTTLMHTNVNLKKRNTNKLNFQYQRVFYETTFEIYDFHFSKTLEPLLITTIFIFVKFLVTNDITF